jgi:hypothetical protein
MGDTLMAFFDFLTGADEAQKAAEKATKKAIAFQREGQDKAAGVLQPGANYAPIQGRLYDLTGLNGAQAQQNAFGQFQESPEVNFLRQQGEQSAMRAAAAGGQLASGRTLAELSRFGQGLASQSYGDYYNRLRDLYGTALGTANNLAGIYGQGGTNLANLQMQGGMQAANYAGQRGGVLGDLLSQGIAAGAYIYGARPGSTASPGSSGSSYSGSGGPPWLRQ